MLPVVFRGVERSSANRVSCKVWPTMGNSGTGINGWLLLHPGTNKGKMAS